MITVETAIAEFLEHRERRHCSVQTIGQYTYQLQELWGVWRKGQAMPEDLQLLQLEEFVQYFRYLELEHVNKRTGQVGLSAHTRDSAWRVLRAFWNYAIRRKWVSAEQKEFFFDDGVIARPRVHEHMRPVIEDDDVYALIQACDTLPTLERARGRALLYMLAETGARIGEVANLQDKNLRLPDRSAKVLGKGGREEWIFWYRSTERALKTYLCLRGGPAGRVFRRLDGEGMTSDDIRRCVKDLARIAGIELPVGAPIHSFRHRFAHKGIARGLDVTQVAQLMRHRAISTTQIYLRENRERLRRIRDSLGEI